MRCFIRKTLRLAPLLALISQAACATDDNSPPAGEALKFLACNPITGTLSFFGPALEHSMDLAVAEINEGGGVLDRPLQLIHANTHSDVEDGMQEIEYYYRRDRAEILAFVGGDLNEISKQIYKIANDDAQYGEKIPFISPASTSPEFSALFDNNNLFFRTVPSALYQATILAEKAHRLGYRKGLILAIADKFGEKLAEAFQNSFRQFGSSTIITYDDFNSQTIHDLLAGAQAQEADFLFIISYGDDGKIILTEWAKNFSRVPLLLSDTLVSDNFFFGLDPATLEKLDQTQVNGVVAGADKKNERYQYFSHKFCAYYPEDCLCPVANKDCEKAVDGIPAIYSANAYDAIYLLALAMDKTGRASPQAVKRGATSGVSTWDVKAISANILAVVNGEQQDDTTITPGQWAQALEALGRGQEINFEGASSSHLEFDSVGDPTTGNFLFWTVKDGHIAYTNSFGQEEAVAIGP